MELCLLIIAIEPFFYKLIETEEKNISNLIPIVKNAIENLPSEDIERRVFLRKFTGEGELKGILDYVPHETTIIEFNKLKDLEGFHEDFIIGPLNMDELSSFYKRILKNKISIFPFTHKLLNSKFYRNVMFYPHVPEMIYVPEFSLYRIKDFDFDLYFKEKNVKRVILKDEFGYHSGQTFNYQIVPVEKINEILKTYKEKARLIEDLGGILVEEFLSGLDSEVFKSHIFGEMIPEEILKFEVHLKGLEGTFKAYTKTEPQLLDKVTTSVGSVAQNIMETLNPHIKINLPHSFSSIDFIIHDNNPIVIDVNSKAGTLGEIQERIGVNDHNPFEFFYEKCCKFSQNEFEKQAEFLNSMEKINLKIRNLDGIFTVSDNEVFNLLTEEKIKLT